mmetsp:Transcript_24714/g.41951  ORF Transcript_24714/g.41951 Transcript_24714/m.41951 type:complete len:151 (-) Transcript_24714:263-715(-)
MLLGPSASTVDGEAAGGTAQQTDKASPVFSESANRRWAPSFSPLLRTFIVQNLNFVTTTRTCTFLFSFFTESQWFSCQPFLAHFFFLLFIVLFYCVCVYQAAAEAGARSKRGAAAAAEEAAAEEAEAEVSEEDEAAAAAKANKKKKTPKA